MRLVEWTGDDGYKHLVWVRNGDKDGVGRERGIPYDPPDVAALGLEPGAARDLHNALVERRLVVWWKAVELTEALRQIAGDDLLGRLLDLYRDRRYTPNLHGVAFDLNGALRQMDISDGQRDCVRNTFAQAGVRTLSDVENAPGKFRGHICNIDIYQLVAHIRAHCLERR